MGKLISLPAEALAARDPRLQGAQVLAERSDGTAIRGELRSLDTETGHLSVHPADGKAAIDLPFSELRLLRFAQDLRHLPGADSKSDRAERPAQPFQLHFHDGGTLQGYARDAHADGVALHLLIDEDGELYRLFLPLVSLERYEIGNLKARGLPAPGQPIEHADDLALLLTSRRSLHAQPASQRIAGQERHPQESPEELARRLGLPFVKLHHFEIDAQALACVPEGIAREHLVLPLFLLDEHLVVAMENPASAEITTTLQFVSGRSIDLCVAAHDDLLRAIQHHYGAHENDHTLQELEISVQRENELQISAQEVERMGQEKPIVRLVNNILTDAIARRASDIHIRPGEDQVELLFRQDGTLVRVRTFSKALLPAVVARIKILGRMNIAERRLPQDGRARMTDHDTVVDLRISVIPTVKGESVVVRLLNVNAGLRTIGEIGFNPQDAELFTDLLHKSYGMILVTGPTGCGKSTTLYAALQEVRRQNVNIITVEDPVEYRMEGIEQIQVNTAPGFTFARALRNILRHDPDVIMVGEIRDQETAKIAVESALTGHLVLSTLHTNDAPTSVTRLIEMGVEAFLVKSSLLGVLAQRLVRLNCPHCLREEPADASVRKFLGVAPGETFYQGAGCEACNQTGFKGRMAVYELLTMTPQMRDMLHHDTPVDDIRRQAIAGGMTPLTEHALKLARERRIALAEVYRVRLQ